MFLPYGGEGMRRLCQWGCLNPALRRGRDPSSAFSPQDDSAACCAGRRGCRPLQEPGTSSTASGPCPPCGARKMLRAYAFPCIFRPLRKRSPRFIRHWRRQPAIPPAEGRLGATPRGQSPRGVLPDRTLDRRLFFDYNPIKYTADRQSCSQQDLGQGGIPFSYPISNEGS